MARRRGPRKLGLLFQAAPLGLFEPRVPASEIPNEPQAFEPGEDCDGHGVSLFMTGMPGEATIEVQIRQGVSPLTAASLLRRMADAIDDDGGLLLNLEFHQNFGGSLYNDGSIEWMNGFSGSDDDDSRPAIL